MTITKEKNGDVLTVAIDGELTLKTAPELAEELSDELDSIKELIIDLKDCGYTSSAGLRVLLNSYQVLDDNGGKMVLKNVNKVFMDILESTGFLDFLEVEGA